MRRFKGDGLPALLLGLAALILYAVTAAPSVATLFDDSLEFQVVLPTLGIAHPSGYPLYTVLGKIVSALLPVRDFAGRLNLLSALFAAAAVSVLFLVARRFAGSRSAAMVASIIFALSPTWWSQATIAEVYALHGLLVAVFLYCLLRWEEERMGHGGDAWLYAAALACGLGLAHHRMIALLLPAAFVLIFWTDPALIRQPRRWLVPIALGLAPLLFYLYLPIRGQFVSSLDGTYRPTLRGTIDWVTARGYSIFLTGNPFNIERRWNDYVALVLNELGALTIIAALLGLNTAFNFHRRRAVFLLIATLTQIAFAVAYKVQDVGVFFIPAFMLICIWAGWGLAPFFDQMAVRGAHAGGQIKLGRRWRPVLLGVWLVPVAVVMLFEPVRNALGAWPERDRRRDWQVYDTGQAMIGAAFQGGRIVGLGGEITLVRYFRDVLGQRPDLQVTRADGEAERYRALDAALARAELVYLTRDLPGAAARYSLDAAGPLILVSQKAIPGPAPAQGQAVGDGVVLLDASMGQVPSHTGVVRVTLQWAATRSITDDLKVSARLLNASGETVAAEDAVPVHFTYPTTAWTAGEIVADAYDLHLRPGDPPGDYSALVILYRAADGSEVGRATLPSVRVVKQRNES